MLEVDTVKCTGCGNCIQACPFNAIALFEAKAKIDQSLCRLCNKCIQVCPEGAIGLVQNPVMADSEFDTQNNSTDQRESARPFCHHPFMDDQPKPKSPQWPFHQGQGNCRGRFGRGLGQGFGAGRGGGKGRGRRV
ncbi:MAG: 4Fe-4S dicluster domain-containing protein [Calditrichaeota bacterium]|nr:4Fe-4S dicluster domain-containing protein [Calditrichota bacterium]